MKSKYSVSQHKFIWNGPKMIELALQLIKPNKSWKCAVVLMEPLFKFTDHAGRSTHNGTIKFLKYYFYLSMLFVSLLISDSSFQLCFDYESRNRHIQHSDTTDFSPENFFSFSISHFCLLLSSLHCFS